jgi:hypothetical protein
MMYSERINISRENHTEHITCTVWAQCSLNVKSCGIWGCAAASLGQWLSAYGNVSVAFILKCVWPFLDPWFLKTKVNCSFEMSETTCSVVQCHIPEDWNSQWHHCQNLKNYMLYIWLPLCYKGSEWNFLGKGMLREIWTTLERLT